MSRGTAQHAGYPPKASTITQEIEAVEGPNCQ